MNTRRTSPRGIVSIYEPEGRASVDVVFIHDLAEDRDKAWERENSNEPPWPQLLSHKVPSARILAYGYNTSWVKDLGSIVDPKYLDQETEKLLKCLADQNEDGDAGADVRPIIIFAHGFGGLIYEQALVWSIGQDDTGREESHTPNWLTDRRHAAFLFGTPHFGAGLAEWAVMSARRLGIPCRRTAQLQDWSGLEDQMEKTAAMQARFREIIRKSDLGIKIIGCFATSPEAHSNLMLSSEWAVLPEFLPIAVDYSHFGMTKLSSNDKAFKAISVILKSVFAELTSTSPPTRVVQPVQSERLTESIKVGTAEDETLADRILDHFEESKFDEIGREFLPEWWIGRLITEDAIKKELVSDSEPLKPEDKRLVRFIHDMARKVFAIAVYCGLGRSDLHEAMRLVESHHFGDENLPIENPRALPPSPRPPALELWSKARIYKFYEEQWKFLAPVFKEDEFGFGFELPPESILPFISVRGPIKDDAAEDDRVQDGVFSRVFEVEVHWSHRYQSDGTSAKIAIKEIYGPNSSLYWEAQAEALRDTRGLNHRHIVRPIAAFKRGKKSYLMTEWAEGGSLLASWKLSPRQSPSADIMRQTLRQLRGLVDALDKLHTLDFASHWHGDLKPGNILIFPDHTKRETLKIGNINVVKHIPTTRYRTTRDELFRAFGDDSPSYDFWSMGCIILEFVIWFLYGYDELLKFIHNAQGGSPYGDEEQQSFKESIQDSPTHLPPFFYLGETRGGKKVEVSALIKWIHAIELSEPESPKSSAIKDLLNFVETKLLIAPFLAYERYNLSLIGSSFEEISDPGSKIITNTPHREIMKVLLHSLDEILDKASDDSYLFMGRERTSTWTERFPIPSAPDPKEEIGYTHRPQDKIWQFIVDNEFAAKVLERVGESALSPPGSLTARLCDRCSHLDFWTVGFCIEDKLSDLRKRSNFCDLCGMLLDVCTKFNGLDKPSVTFERIGSTIHMGGNLFPPVLSICRSHGLRTPVPIQLGFPGLPKAGGETFFKVIETWLTDCNETHPNCEPPIPTSLPTRLIEVGESGSSAIRLYETRPGDRGHYIAMSHLWNTSLPLAMTTTSNVERFKKEIPFDGLPKTFQDAVITTRALRIRYLWIDAICIIQGSDGDSTEEMMRVEDYFSAAYCVIAATRATEPNPGFLGPRRERKFITLRNNSEKPFYICEAIDDFDRDVLRSPLHQRGWVLRERALARRSIFFAENQTYFECGNGVRCETLSLMHNPVAAFLGDPQFPTLALKAPLGGRVALFQYLYIYYSRLGLTNPQDRPLAIAALEKRLAQAFNVRGSYGMFEGDLFHYSLLWRRGLGHPKLESMASHIPTGSLESFSFTTSHIPTWSWMAHDGGIDYINPPFATVDWENLDVTLPGSESKGPPYAEIRADLTEFELTDNGDEEGRIIYDDPGQSIYDDPGQSIYDDPGQSIYDDPGQSIYDDPGQIAKKTLKCVVLGSTKEGSKIYEKRFYVLIVTPEPGLDLYDIYYMRVGVGVLPGHRMILKPAPRVILV